MSSEIKNSIPRSFWWFIVALWAGLFIASLSGHPNYLGNEKRVGGYVLDVLQNGQIWAQRDGTGEVMAKPPFNTWMVALADLLSGGLNQFSLYFPSSISALIL